MSRSLFASSLRCFAALALGLAFLGSAGIDSAEARPRVRIFDSSRSILPYKRPVQTTPAQRAAQQGLSCITCGKSAPRMHADHKEPLIRQHHYGPINSQAAKRLDAVQPQCPTCSARQGGQLRAERQRLQNDHKANLDRVRKGCPIGIWLNTKETC